MNLSSDEEDFSSDTTSDYDDLDETTDDDNNNDDSDNEPIIQPIHFRECLRLLDAALAASNPPKLPSWCASQQIPIDEDPMLIIHGQETALKLPLNKVEARKILRIAQPFPIKIDIVDGISFLPSVHHLCANSFRILNLSWMKKIDAYVKQSCIYQSLQLNPNEIELKVSRLLLLEPCNFPRQFTWLKEEQNSKTIAKLFISLPSIYKGGKQTIRYNKEVHVFDSIENDLTKSFYYTIVPLSDKCTHEIDYISKGYKLMLVYDVVTLNSTIFYNVDINETILIRVNKIFETWINGLEHEYHGYSLKIILPFTDTFHFGNNVLLYGYDRVVGTILRRTIENFQSDKLLLYQGIIQPNRSNDGTVHACRLLTNLQLINQSSTDHFFQKIDVCIGNCNETYSGNIFLRKTISEQGNHVPIEEFLVPIWCIVPVSYKYDLLIDNIPYVLNYLKDDLIPNQMYSEILILVNWLLSSGKKINFNSKQFLHELVRLLSDNGVTFDLIGIFRKLFEHKKFIEDFFPFHTKQEYDDIISILNISNDTKIQLDIHKLFRTTLQRRSRDKDRIKDAIKFIGILSSNNINRTFIFVLIEELILNIFQLNNSVPPMIDLIHLLSILSISTDSYKIPCEILSQQIMRQIKLMATTTTSSSAVINVLRTVLVPTLIHIFRQMNNENQLLHKRKFHTNIDYPCWFLSLYQTCLSILDDYCNSSRTIPIFENMTNSLDRYCCSICDQLFVFLQDIHLFERKVLIPKEKMSHLNSVTHQLDPLTCIIQSMTADKKYYRINIIKMSTYEQEMNRENNLLRSILLNIQPSNYSHNQSHSINKKRFKSS